MSDCAILFPLWSFFFFPPQTYRFGAPVLSYRHRRVSEFLVLPLDTEQGGSGLKQAPDSASRAMAPGTEMLPLAQSSGHFRTGIPCGRGCQTKQGHCSGLQRGCWRRGHINNPEETAPWHPFLIRSKHYVIQRDT